jgi:hypothetical protein
MLAEHITEGGIVQWDVQQQPDNIVWSTRSDGTLLGFTYERDQNVTGWHRHIVGATDAVSKQIGTDAAGDYVTPTSETALGDVFTFRLIQKTVSGAGYAKIFAASTDSNPLTTNSIVFYLERDNGGNDALLHLKPNGVAARSTTSTQISGASYASQIQLCMVDGWFRYDFEDGSGTTISDSIGSNDGTLTTADAVAFWANTRSVAADSDDFESVAIVPVAGGEDEIYVSCAVDVSGEKKRLIGRLIDREWGTDYTTEWRGSDFHKVYTSPGTTTLTGLDYLEGRTVTVVADGVVKSDATVYGGSITIDADSYTTVVVGLPFTSTVAPLYLISSTQYGTSKGGRIGNRDATIRFKDTYSAKVGQSTDSLESVIFDPDATALYNGDSPARFDNASDWLLTTYIVQDEPMPCTVLAMIPNVEDR